MLIGIVVTAAVSAPAAEVPVRRWGLGLEGGVMKLQEGAWDYAAADQYGRLRLARGLSRHWSLGAAWLVGHTRAGVGAPGGSAGWSFDTEPPYCTLVSQPMLELEHRLSPGAWISPTLTAGIGLTSWRVISPGADGGGWFPEGDTVTGYDQDGDQVELSGANPTIGFGVGFDVTLSNSWHLGFGGRYQVLHGNDRDNVGQSASWGPEHVDANTALTSAWAGLTWWPGSSDGDGDGVSDKNDACPDQAEDRDGFNDLDGCPDPDNDGDGTPDGRDLCPQLAEDRDGWKDDDGCPDEEADVDHDGVDYDHDRCPLEPGVQPDGCPRTPAPALAAFGLAPLPASASAPPSASASPNGDLDGDRVPDAEDRCPGTAEDRDDFEDDDGCPEPDNDLDGIPDLKDRCPFDAETINGVADDDGCPDVGTAAVFFKSNKVVFTGTVRFRTGSAALDPTSFPLLKQVAAVLKAAASVSVEIQGHTDDVGNAAANIKLSKQRAQTIRAFMTKAGVAAGRLTAVGYGPTRPRASNKTADGREQNRRVEFVILGESK